jgi:hypothetical protein
VLDESIGTGDPAGGTHERGTRNGSDRPISSRAPSTRPTAHGPGRGGAPASGVDARPRAVGQVAAGADTPRPSAVRPPERGTGSGGARSRLFAVPGQPIAVSGGPVGDRPGGCFAAFRIVPFLLYSVLSRNGTDDHRWYPEPRIRGRFNLNSLFSSGGLGRRPPQTATAYLQYPYTCPVSWQSAAPLDWHLSGLGPNAKPRSRATH